MTMTARQGEGTGIEMISRPDAAATLVEAWYDIAEAGHFWVQWRHAMLMRAARSLGLRADAPLAVLDVGCGHGVASAMIEAETVWRVDRADLNLAALERVQGARGRVMYYDVYDRSPGLVGRYDLVFLNDVLEHVERPEAFVAACLAHLAPGGRLICNVPASQALYSAYDVAVGHLRRYSPAMMRQTMVQAAAEVLDLRYWGLALVPIACLRKALMARAARRGDVVAAGFQPPSALLNRALSALGRIEARLIDRPVFGTSLLAVVRPAPGEGRRP